MRHRFFIHTIIFVLVALMPMLVSGQKDTTATKTKSLFENKVVRKKNFELPQSVQPENKFSSFSFGNIGLTQPKPLTLPKLTSLPQEEQKNIMMPEQFADNGARFNKTLNKTYGEKERKGNTVDTYLGDVKTGGKIVKIVCRDHEYVDGDRVRVYWNDEIIEYNILLTSSFRVIEIELAPGFNKIDFEALNQGTSGPNTAEFRVFDENGAVLAGSQWNLTTGVKGTLIVVKE
ncbi:hypothetical protein [Spongiivirga citrea]|uniref:Secreted protein n=1 Tax=Spongiivirga citrea TaxID=1481457 RepID=A0A6M0CGT6_9FLAO|nr:hypothetical protein [Spongiivirga citrea]NER16712.1 hypothetical protein [Spongiivirga citrea]